MPPRSLYLPFFLGSRLVVWLVTFDNMGVRVRETLGTEHFVEIVFPGELVEGRINNTRPGRQSTMLGVIFFWILLVVTVAILQLVTHKIRHHWLGKMPFLSFWALMFSMVPLGSTSRAMTLPVRASQRPASPHLPTGCLI